jgi:hypothetical protein
MAETDLVLSSMTPQAVAEVARLERESLKRPQVDIATEHTFHAGVYARTVTVPEGVLLTGALIKIPTLVIVSGDAVVYGDSGPRRIAGYHVLPGEGGRKQAFLAISETSITMIFATKARSIEEAEDEFTDEADRLFSRRDGAQNFAGEGS